MPNWTSIDETAIKTAKNASILQEVRSQASGEGCADPLPEMIADTVAQIRSLCSVGNTLDADTTKIPNSLKGLALRMITRALKDYISLPLTEDEKERAREDASYRNRIADEKIRFESPDIAAGNAEMQDASGMKSSSSCPTTRHEFDGLL